MKPAPATLPAPLRLSLGGDAPAQWVSVGNVALLDEPLLGLISSRECPSNVLLETLERVLEWAAAGRVVVASRRALVTPQLERAGLVEAVEPQPASLAAGLSRLLERRARWPELAARARTYAREHFGADAVGRRLMALLQGSITTCV